MKIAALATLLGLFLGCGGSANDGAGDSSCAIHPGDVIGYQDCNKTTQGMSCVAMCGILPADGATGHLIPVGCTVQIGTSTPRTGFCVNSCADCN